MPIIATMVTHFVAGRQELNIDALDHGQWHFLRSEVKGKLSPGQNVHCYFHIAPCAGEGCVECFGNRPLLSELLD